MWVEDTIAAIATPLGEGGLAVVRLSGAQALAVADEVFAASGGSSSKPSTFASHTLHHGRIVRQGQVVDETLMAVMRAPRTYTREHVVEFSCHGGLLVARLVLDVMLEHGARLALPGEFTRRAFLNGRIDLAQAEAVADLIHSRTELALAAANEQLAGRLSQRVNRLRDDLMQTLAHVEAHIDFPEEDIAANTRTQLVQRLNQARALMEELLETAHEGQILRQGIRAAIIGRPNVGKSSLLNLLLGHDRAIVSPHPGTTRDTIEESANIRGLPVVFIDTAGMRPAINAIESEGIQRSRHALEKAELVLLVLDASEPMTLEDQACLQLATSRKQILVLNKTDLPSKLALPSELCSTTAQPTVRVSCVTGEGLESLKDAIKQSVWAGDIRPTMLQVVINARHQDALRRARDAALAAVETLTKEHSLELVAVDLRLAANAVGEIVGKTSTEDLLDSIFSQFCIGK